MVDWTRPWNLHHNWGVRGTWGERRVGEVRGWGSPIIYVVEMWQIAAQLSTQQYVPLNSRYGMPKDWSKADQSMIWNTAPVKLPYSPFLSYYCWPVASCQWPPLLVLFSSKSQKGWDKNLKTKKLNCPFSHFTLLLNFFILMGMEKPQIIIGNFGGHYWAFLTKEFTKVWYQSMKRPSKSIQADTSANPRLTRKRYGVALPWGDVYTLASLADDVPQSNDPTAGIEFVISANPQHPSPLQINKKN